MIDPAHQADQLAHAAFHPFFPDRYPLHLGAETFRTTYKRLRTEGFRDVDHAQEVFARSLTNGLSFLHRNGGGSVEKPRPWFHKICFNETTHYLVELSASECEVVLSVVDGETDLLDDAIYDPKKVDAILRAAIAQLAPREQQLIRLDMVDRLSPDEIEKRMGIPSHGYFLKLKSQAFTALRLAVKTLIEKGIASLF